MKRFAALLLLSGALLATSASLWAQDDDTSMAMARAEKTLGPEGTAQDTCSNCHTRETDAWKQSTHFRTFVERHRSEEAKKILAAMGIRSMKRSDACLGCHYTSVVESDRLRPKWGVSCESCHGPGRDWMDVHNKIGGDKAAKALEWGEGHNESAEAHRKRLAAAEAHGMISSGMTYGIASNCFGCHTVPDEKLVNVGGHKAGSDFDLVAWSQGEVRHNYVSSAGAPDNPSNRPASIEEKRRLYAIGALVDLEFSLRNLAAAKEPDGAFRKAMAERVVAARAKAGPVVKAVGDPVLSAAFDAIPEGIDATTAVKPELASKLGAATRGIVDKTNGLSTLDSLIPKDSKGSAAP